MKRSLWKLIGGAMLLLLGQAAPGQAQSLAGTWQGVETDTGEPDTVWPAVLRVQKSSGIALFGVLYQELQGQPGMSATYQVQGTRTAGGMRLAHGRKLAETGRTPFTYWCEGSITFTYDPALEKLTGHATYRPKGDCDVGTFTFYRVKLKSADTVPANTETTLRVSGRNVLWYADADLQHPLAAGNTYRTQLKATTTFYLTQSYYPTRQSPVVPITVAVAAPWPAPSKLPAPAPLAPTMPALQPGGAAARALPDSVPPPSLAAAPATVLPTVLFRLGTAELLPDSYPALDQLAAELQRRPALQLRVAGHTDRIGEPRKNQVLSEQRAEAVKAYLVQAGVAAQRLRTACYGDSRLLYPSPDARNRRVEVSWLAD